MSRPRPTFWFPEYRSSVLTVKQLLANPSTLQKAVSEVRTLFKSESEINLITVNSILPYLNAVLDESLRLYPPVPSSLPRLTPHHHTICDIPIPAGTQVGVHVSPLPIQSPAAPLSLIHTHPTSPLTKPFHSKAQQTSPPPTSPTPPPSFPNAGCPTPKKTTRLNSTTTTAQPCNPSQSDHATASARI